MEFSELIKKPEAEGKEKHVPVIEIDERHSNEQGAIVRVTVGKDVPHPNTVEHYIVWAELFGIKQNGQVVSFGRTDFAPTLSSPTLNVRVSAPLGDFKAFAALSYCNIHGLWGNVLEI